ncbi:MULTISPECIES: hypothetical protein [unclassified Rhodococcus (in: high G+C Gram-positive bacteria)]|uniref:hypothetical protein n=1 Tax=Rhodococcus TaxID=1827 RepID=UPI0013030E53|nr:MULTISPECIES: hypothetical protein [unclassified Rhodococcus (in: high G+C Gram-positive bacteria)]MDZ7918412.1 hypothetical protein [Rhodococcus sp. (in: high G+C Gram-positive bacteria)]
MHQQDDQSNEPEQPTRLHRLQLATERTFAAIGYGYRLYTIIDWVSRILHDLIHHG